MNCDLCNRDQVALMTKPTSDLELWKRGWMVVILGGMPYEVCERCARFIAQRVADLSKGTK
jgi:hypothetical protein